MCKDGGGEMDGETSEEEDADFFFLKKNCL